MIKEPRFWIVLGLLGLVLVGLQFVPHNRNYVAELENAAGIRAGYPVRVAGITVGEVTKVAAVGDRVVVNFGIDSADVQLTEDTQVQVKIGSLLGQRYLDLTPGKLNLLAEGGTIDRKYALTSYTLEKFWLDASPVFGKLDLQTLQQSIEVLSTELVAKPKTTKQAIAGIANVSAIIAKRNQQVSALIVSSEKVTKFLIAQQGKLNQLMDNADVVMKMIYQRREAIRALLRDGRNLIAQVTNLAKTNAAPMRRAMIELSKVQQVLLKYKNEIDRTLQVAAPAMRLYTNSVGDGPWLGVNAPGFVLPDDVWCLVFSSLRCQ